MNGLSRPPVANQVLDILFFLPTEKFSSSDRNHYAKNRPISVAQTTLANVCFPVRIGAEFNFYRKKTWGTSAVTDKTSIGKDAGVDIDVASNALVDRISWA